jgi:hypothetical protein
MAINWNKAGVDVTQYTKSQVEVALISICTRPYWKRLWIIQKVLSASSVDILCDSKVLGWEDFWTGLQVISNLKIVGSRSEGTCASTPAYAITQVASSHSQNYTMGELIHLCWTCESQCEDIRDRIYGLLSLAKDFDIVILPDYSKSALNLYFDVARAHLSATHDPPEIFQGFWDETAVSCHVIATVRQLLGDLLWHCERKNFSASYYLSAMPLSQNFGAGLFEMRLFVGINVAKVGPVISTATSLNKNTVFGSTWPSSYLLRENRMVSSIINDLSRLSRADFHRTAVIGEEYISLGDPHKTFVPVKMPIGAKRQDSDGTCRAFFTPTSLSDCGIASSAIQEGDLLCCIPCFGFCIVRPAEMMSSFILVSRAILKHENRSLRRRSSLGEFYYASKSAYLCHANSTENDEFKIFIDLETLLF